MVYFRVPTVSEPANPTEAQIKAQLNQWISSCNAPCITSALNAAIAATNGGVAQNFQTELNNLFDVNTEDLNLNHEAAGIFLTIGKDGRRFALKENHLYGSARLGVDNRDTALYDNTKSGISRVWNPFYPQGTDGGWFDLQQGSEEPPFVAQIGEISSFTRGLKAYEISNHLGNVLVTVSDKKFGYGTTVADGVLQMDPTSDASYFQPEILSAQDYYAFGATKPGRRGSLKKNAEGNIAFVFDEAADVNNWRPLYNYRFAFNGKEADKKIWSEERLAYDYGFRIFGPGQWASPDPLAGKYPSHSPYMFSFDNPINIYDEDGREGVPVSIAFELPPKSLPKLKPHQWYVWGGVATDPESFDKAASYNLKNGKADAYTNIHERSEFYEWVDKKISKKTGSRWFKAASIVTGWNSVGAADHHTFGALSADAKEFLKAGNEYLFCYNLENARKLIENGELTITFKAADGEMVSTKGLKGRALDYAMVKFEQTKIRDFIAQYKSEHPSINMEAIMSDLNTSMTLPIFPPTEVLKVMKNKFTNEKGENTFNFPEYKKRKTLGTGIVDILHEENNKEKK